MTGLDRSEVGQQDLRSDVYAPEKRSAIISRIHSSNTKPELQVRSLLHRAGYRFRVNRKDLPGSPDIVLPRFRLAIFVHGCFWHQHPGCRKATVPKNNAEFWRTKLDKNIERDKRAATALSQDSWEVVTIWECELKGEMEPAKTKLNGVLSRAI